jgi:hypothetical protein
VTNTLTNARGTTTASTTSAYARITVSSIPQVERLTLRQSAAIYRFDLPQGASFGDYEKITVEYRLNATNLAKNLRFNRLYGNFKEDDFNPTGNWLLAPFDAYNAAYILADNGGAFSPIPSAIPAAVADTWFTQEYPLDGSKKGSDFNTNNLPAAGDTGPFYFGIGLAGESGDQVIQMVKNITMVHKTDAALNIVTNKDGFGGIAFAGYSGTDGLSQNNRVWVNDPDYVAPTP